MSPSELEKSNGAFSKKSELSIFSKNFIPTSGKRAYVRMFSSLCSIDRFLSFIIFINDSLV